MDYSTQLLYICQKIKRLRIERKLTVQDLAYKCDIERSNLSRIEAGRTNLTLKTMCTICNALGVELADIMPPKGIYISERLTSERLVAAKNTTDTNNIKV